MLGIGFVGWNVGSTRFAIWFTGGLMGLIGSGWVDNGGVQVWVKRMRLEGEEMRVEEEEL